MNYIGFLDTTTTLQIIFFLQILPCFIVITYYKILFVETRDGNLGSRVRASERDYCRVYPPRKRRRRRRAVGGSRTRNLPRRTEARQPDEELVSRDRRVESDRERGARPGNAMDVRDPCVLLVRDTRQSGHIALSERP